MATHPGLQQVEDSSEQTGVIEGETGLCGFEERTNETAAMIPMLSPSPQMPSFLGQALSPPYDQSGRYSSPLSQPPEAMPCQACAL